MGEPTDGAKEQNQKVLSGCARDWEVSARLEPTMIKRQFSYKHGDTAAALGMTPCMLNDNM